MVIALVRAREPCGSRFEQRVIRRGERCDALIDYLSLRDVVDFDARLADLPHEGVSGIDVVVDRARRDCAVAGRVDRGVGRGRVDEPAGVGPLERKSAYPGCMEPLPQSAVALLRPMKRSEDGPTVTDVSLAVGMGLICALLSGARNESRLPL
jgi:hypothetical protein